MYTVSFPGLGIENLTINDTAFTVFGRDVKWYGIIITFGMILACLYAYTRAKHEKISADDLTDYALFCIIFGIIGARAYYVIFHFDSFLVTAYDSFWKNFLETLKNIVSIWNGGLAIYGGIIAGFIVICIISRIKKIKVAKFLDVAAPSVMIGQIFGRWGNFMNQEAFGTNTTLPWGMYSNGTHDYLAREQSKLAEMGITVDPNLPVHPTFLYESLWNLIGFLLIHSLYKKKKYDGQVFLLYVAWYGFGRMIIEEFRTDSLMLGPIRISQLVALVTMLAAVAVLLVKAIRSKGTSTEAVTADGEASDAEALCEEAEENEPSTIFSNDEGENEECEEESDGENDSEADSLTANENTEDTTEDNKESTDGN